MLLIHDRTPSKNPGVWPFTWKVTFSTDQSTHFLGSSLDRGGGHANSHSVPAACLHFIQCPPHQLQALLRPKTHKARSLLICTRYKWVTSTSCVDLVLPLCFLCVLQSASYVSQPPQRHQQELNTQACRRSIQWVHSTQTMKSNF